MDPFSEIAVRWKPLFIYSIMLLVPHAQSHTLAQRFVARQGFYDKVRSAKQEVSDNFYKQPKGMTNDITMVTTMLWSKQLNMSSEYPHILRAANHTQILSGDQLWEVKQEQLSHIILLPTNFKDMDVQLVQGTEWHKTQLLLVCFKKHRCSLFITNHTHSFSYRQSISDFGNPIDAQFFEQQNSLFLAVLYQQHNSTDSKLRIYRWNLSLDLEPTPIISSSALSLIVFNCGENVLFVLGCSEYNQVKFSSEVWCRKPDGNIFRVQYLPANKYITYFTQKDEHFLLVSKQKSATAIYWWEGNEFIEWVAVDKLLEYTNVFVCYNIKNTAFFVFTNGPSFKIYVMISTRLEKVFEMDNYMDQTDEHLSKDELQDLKIIKLIMYEENKKIYILVQSKVKETNFITLINVHIKFSNPYETGDQIVMETSRVEKRVSSLLNGIGSLENQTRTLLSMLPSLLLTNRQTTINATARVSALAKVLSGNIWSVTNIDASSARKIKKLVSTISYLGGLIETLSTALVSAKEYKNTKHLTYNGDLFIESANINSLSSATVNNRQFVPESFLSLNSDQRLVSIKAKTLKVDSLVTLNKIANRSVDDLLLTGTMVKSPVKTNHLAIHSLQMGDFTEINNILVRDIINRNSIVTSGEDTNTIRKVASKQARRQKMIKTLQLQDFRVIDNLIVDVIDNIPILDLFNSIYINEFHNVINGSLHFKKGLRSKQLILKKIPEAIPQFPEVNPKFPPQLNPNIVKFYKSLLHKHDSAQNPHYQIRPMLMPYQPPVKTILYPVGRIKRDNEKSSKNIFKTKVKILGNFKVNQLLFHNSLLNASNQFVPTSNLDNFYWTSKTPQVISTSVHFSKGISLLNDLKYPVVNGKNLTNSATRNSMYHSLFLENIHVVGNISSEEDPISLEQLGRGVKVLENSEFEVKHIHTNYINGDNAQRILLKDDLLSNDLRIVTGNLTIKGSLQAGLINEINVQEKFETAVMVDSDTKLGELIYNDISANFAEIDFINNHTTDMLLESMTASEDINFTVSMNDNLHLSKLTDVSFVNGKSTNLSLVVRKSKPATVYGRKYFKSQVSINNLTITNINGKHVGNLFKNLLRTSSNHDLSGFVTIRNASMKSQFEVNDINSVNISKLVYINQPQVNMTSNFRFSSLMVKGNLTSTSILNGCVLPQMKAEGVVFDYPTAWTTLQVMGNSKWLPTPNGKLHHFLDSAVTSTTDQTITGNVLLTNGFFRDVITDSLNGKNFNFIMKDSLSKKKENQRVSGKKHFTGIIRCDNVHVKGDARFGSINSLNIEDIDSRLVRRTVDYNVKNKPVKGHKTFMSGFKASRLRSSGGVNGIAEGLIARDNFPEILPPLYVRSLTITGNIQAKIINSFNIDRFINDCVYLNHSDTQFIGRKFHIQGNVTFQGNVTTSNINNIPNNELVFVKSGKNPISITKCKRFTKNILIDSNFNATILNGNSLSARYKMNMKIHENTTVKGSLELKSATELSTLYAQKVFVGSKQLMYLNGSYSP
ncbi:uncharacterized protein LOC124369136 [Homalodisca vitripennis]|uniref:uncharacterized protein LOC124369136 n=1 Tax=Homalodisca vitripennis TaxID=197043 RepID=UPI001EEBAC47|nr:uncharacterized protein LOC124369136 [Homalodisca vitripennis]